MQSLPYSHANGFLADSLKTVIHILLVLSVSTFCPNHCFHSSRHALYQSLTDRCIDCFPFLLCPLPKFLDSIRWVLLQNSHYLTCFILSFAPYIPLYLSNSYGYGDDLIHVYQVIGLYLQ